MARIRLRPSDGIRLVNSMLNQSDQNFSQMYEVVDEELIRAGVAVRLPEPVWMDAEGNHVERGDADGCKVNIDIIKPEMCIVADEVGGNTSQKDDGKIGGERWLTEFGTIHSARFRRRTNITRSLGSLS